MHKIEKGLNFPSDRPHSIR